MRIGVYGALGLTQGTSDGDDSYFLHNFSDQCTLPGLRAKIAIMSKAQDFRDPCAQH